MLWSLALSGKLMYSAKNMKDFLFQLVTRISALIIKINLVVMTTINSWIGKIAYALMALIDRKRLNLYEQIAEAQNSGELESQQTELNLLSAAGQVRDHAREMGDWTDNHTVALNAIAEALVVEMGWEEEQVQRYMTEVVKSIDDLEIDFDI